MLALSPFVRIQKYLRVAGLGLGLDVLASLNIIEFSWLITFGTMYARVTMGRSLTSDTELRDKGTRKGNNGNK